ncbi:hypothetical protein AQUCO_00100706v1 [Aquilegia coerulea]|uniref:Pentacotripeptide-repeat region of PRORP domain-containing protein n=1 Tax=Aquilegia coerulea TaxID=218851 RepID=A0A2G5FBK3_AQUCA|nr:hypothetical protein AQUCO_00100706v1 [Aquilegia coerulea]
MTLKWIQKHKIHLQYPALTLRRKPRVNIDEYSVDVEKIYRILRKFHSRAPKLELALQESGVVVNSGLVERVLSRCGDAGSLGYRFFAWASKQPGYRHNYQVYKSIIKILGKMRQFDNPDLLTADAFVVLMRRFASARMVKKAIQVLDEMPKYGCEPDEHVFGCLLDALCKNGSVKEAASLFEDMRYKFTLSLKHFTSLLYGWVFSQILWSTTNLLSGYALEAKMLDAYDLLQEMKRKECDPNATSYTILIQALCSRDRMEEAMQVFADMRKNECAADVVTYTILISGFCKWGKINRGYELLDSMIQQRLTPNQMSYFHIMVVHEKKEQLEECSELVEEMTKIGCLPDLTIYNTVIRLACKLGEVDDGVRAWNQMESCGIAPGLNTFTIMIHGFLGQGYLIEACKYFKKMVGRGLLSAPQYRTLKELLNYLLRAEKLEMAKDVWTTIVSQGCELNVFAWTIWIHALFKVGYVKEACSYCLDMMDAGIAVEITDKVRKMAADRQITFKMYKRRGERDLKEKVKANDRGRKRRARRLQWGRGQGRANIM